MQKKAGHKPQKRKFDIQEHYDDCGSSLAGLEGADKDMYYIYEDFIEYCSTEEESDLDEDGTHIVYHIYHGSESDFLRICLYTMALPLEQALDKRPQHQGDDDGQ